MIARSLVIIALVIAGTIATLAQLDQQTRISPGYSALVPAISSGNAARERSKIALRLGNREQALKDAQTQIRFRPMPAESLSTLALAALETGNAEMASAALGAASQRGWREPVSQLASGQAALRQGENAVAAQRISALLATGKLTDPAIALLNELLTQPDGRAAFARQVASRGYWQSNSLLPIYRTVDKRQWAQTLALALENGAELDCRALSALTQAYQKDGRGEEAELFQQPNCMAD